MPGPEPPPEPIRGAAPATATRALGTAPPVPAPVSPTVSVAVVSRGRPEALRRCLLALAQQYHPDFEVVVVADAAGCRVASEFPAKVLRFEAANVAAARNAAIGLAAGALIAFIDDDAMAEPTWLARLAAPFALPGVVAAGGHVLGRNGISLQWGARELDAGGSSHPLPDPPPARPGAGWGLLCPTPGRAARVEGTNMAFRRRTLLALGGFDPGFAFYHDESELCWRLALAAAGQVASVPGALVHHGVLPSALRRADRVPRDLFAVGRSSARFLARHAPGRIEAARAALRAEQRRRLLRHVVAGRLWPQAARRLLQGLDRGFAEGLTQPAAPGPWLEPGSPPPFRRFARPPAEARFLAGPVRDGGRLLAEARAARAGGRVVTLLLLEPGLRAHRVRFGEDGIWHQRGGLWGRTGRQEPRLQPGPLSARIARERARCAGTRAPDRAADSAAGRDPGPRLGDARDGRGREGQIPEGRVRET